LSTADGAPLTLGPVSGGPRGAVVTGHARGLDIAFLSSDGIAWTGTDPVGSTATEQVSGVALTSAGQAIVPGATAGDAAEQPRGRGGGTAAGADADRRPGRSGQDRPARDPGGDNPAGGRQRASRVGRRSGGGGRRGRVSRAVGFGRRRFDVGPRGGVGSRRAD